MVTKSVNWEDRLILMCIVPVLSLPMTEYSYLANTFIANGVWSGRKYPPSSNPDPNSLNQVQPHKTVDNDDCDPEHEFHV